jgi:hypothetical protein
MANAAATYRGNLDSRNAGHFAGLNQRLYVLRYWFWLSGRVLALSAERFLRSDDKLSPVSVAGIGQSVVYRSGYAPVLRNINVELP